MIRERPTGGAAVLAAVQHPLRLAFLATERVYNRAFGDASNPFYHLGAIANFLLWAVVVTGLYLYIFFRTGVAEAYDSVQHLTREQWWLGGVMRSIHRYASDAMVLAMALHMTRHFAFDRYRGFRWFSWFSGVVLLWMVYVSGINGYMLPWDRTAQFVTVATAEWLDVLPVFKGALVRNFITPDAVNDRLFSLLSFLHIGLPLAVLALLWVHTQRVPGAHTMPPRALRIGVILALVALSLVKPAVSGPPANLATAPTTMPFDWFYLTIYPLIYLVSPASLAAWVAIATLLLMALPWLPRKRRRPGERHLLVRPDNRLLPMRAGETLLECALRHRVPFPYDCRNGGCGECKCTVLHGDVEQEAHDPAALTADEMAKGRVLACTSFAESDVEIEYVPATPLAGIEPRRATARVIAMRRATDDVMVVRLEVDGEPMRYRAGQYLDVVLDDGQRRSFSFATAPGDDPCIELHIRRIPGGRFTTHVFEAMKVGDRLEIEGPLGSFHLREDTDKPIIFVAGATGFAPVKSMLEHAFESDLERRMILYWGVRSRKDLYLGDLCEQWAREHPNFTFVPVLSAPLPEDHWTGRTGLVHEAILADFPDLAGLQVYACGSVAMIEAAHPALLAHGVDKDDCFSDAFRLMPQRARTAEAAEMVRLGGA